MVTALLLLALILASVTAFYFYLKGGEKDREISRLNSKASFLQGAWDDSKILVKNRSEEVNSLKDLVSSMESDLASLVDKLSQKDKVITEMAHQINGTPQEQPVKGKSDKKPKKPIKPRAKKAKK